MKDKTTQVKRNISSFVFVVVQPFFYFEKFVVAVGYNVIPNNTCVSL